MITKLLDYLYYFIGSKGKCYACNYKNMPVYRCPNPNCLKMYCLDCWEDNTGQFVCKKCEVIDWN